MAAAPKKGGRDEEEKEGEETKEEAKKGGKKMIIIIAAVVLLLVLGGGGAFMMMGAKKAPEEGAEEGGEEGHAGDDAEAVGEGEDLPGAVVPLETFIVNLRLKGSFLKTTIQLQLTEPEIPKSVENDIPKIRDAIITLLSDKESKDVLDGKGKTQLREEIKRIVNQTLGSEDVTQVYFTEFIVQ